MIYALYILIFLLFVSGLWLCCEKKRERSFAVSLLRVMTGVPLLTGEYVLLTHFPSPHTVLIVSVTEFLFALIWLETALFLQSASDSRSRVERGLVLSEMPFTFTAGSLYCFSDPPVIAGLQWEILYPHGVVFFFSNLVMLLSMSIMAWDMELFWRKLSARQRWEYKFW